MRLFEWICYGFGLYFLAGIIIGLVLCGRSILTNALSKRGNALGWDLFAVVALGIGWLPLVVSLYVLFKDWRFINMYYGIDTEEIIEYSCTCKQANTDMNQ